MFKNSHLKPFDRISVLLQLKQNVFLPSDLHSYVSGVSVFSVLMIVNIHASLTDERHIWLRALDRQQS